VLQKAFETRQVEKYISLSSTGDREARGDRRAAGKTSSAEAGWRMVADAKGDSDHALAKRCVRGRRHWSSFGR
jgi:hypothetical protein